MPLTYNKEEPGFSEVGHPVGVVESPQVEPGLEVNPTGSTIPDALKPALLRQPGVTGGSLDVPETGEPLPSPEFDKQVTISEPENATVTTQEPDQPSVLGAAFRQENLVVDAIHALSRDHTFPVEPDHNPWNSIKGTDLEGNWSSFLGSRSQAETDQIAARIRAEHADQERLGNAGLAGTGAMLLAGILDPTMLIPLGGEVIKGIQGVRTVGKAAAMQAAKEGAIFGGITAVHETGLHALQEDRSLSTSAIAVGGSMVMGALLGAGASGLASREFSRVSANLENVLKVPTDSGSDPFGMGGLDTLIKEGQSAGAAAVTKSEARLKPILGLEKVNQIENPIGRVVTAPLRWVMRQDPLIRSLTSPIPSVREAATQLAETVLGLTRNAKGEATAPLGGSVETGVATRGTSIEGQAVRETDAHFADYVKRIKSEGGKPMRDSEFWDEVGRAKVRFNKHEIPEVAKASKYYDDNLFTPTGKQAVKYGIFKKEVLGGEPAADTAARTKNFPGAGGEDGLKPIKTMVAGIEKALGTKPDAELTSATVEALGRVNPDVLENVKATFEAHSGPPPPKPGTVRVFHGGSTADDYDGPLWFTTHQAKAEGYAEKSSAGRVHYLDLPEDHPMFETDYPEQGVKHGFTFEKELQAGDVASRKLLQGGDASTKEALAKALDDALAHPSAAPSPDEFAPNTAARVWDDQGQSYLSRLYNKQMIAKRYAEFKKILTDWIESRQVRAQAILDSAESGGEDAGKLAEFVGLEPDAVDSIAHKIIENILGHPDGLMMFDAPAGVSGPLKARTLRIPDALIEEFLERNIRHVARYYIRTVIPQLEMHRVFGDLEMTGLRAKISDEANALASAAKTEKASNRIMGKGGFLDEGVSDLIDMRDRIMGRFNTSDPSTKLVRTGRAIRQWNILSHLGNMTLSAMSDPFRIMMVHGVQAQFGDAFLPMLDNLKGLKLAAEDVRLSGTALDIELGTRSSLLSDALDDYGRYSKFERTLHWSTEKFGFLSGMNHWNAVWKSVAGAVTIKKIVQAAQRVAEGTATGRDIEKLAASSIEAPQAKLIAAQFEKHGQVIPGTIGSTVFHPNTLAWDVSNPNVRNAVEALRAAVKRDVDRIIVTPGQDKPLWMSKEVGALTGQFQSFGMATVQRTILAGLQQRDAGVLIGVMSMLGMGAMSVALRNLANGKPQPDNAAQWIENSIDASGLVAYVFQINHFAEQFTGGAVGLSALTGKPISRYAARNWADAVLGPTAGTVKDLASATGDISRHIAFGEQMHESDVRALRRVLPLQNLFYLSWLFRQLEQSTSNALGAVPSGKR